MERNRTAPTPLEQQSGEWRSTNTWLTEPYYVIFCGPLTEIPKWLRVDRIYETHSNPIVFPRNHGWGCSKSRYWRPWPWDFVVWLGYHHAQSPRAHCSNTRESQSRTRPRNGHTLEAGYRNIWIFFWIPWSSFFHVPWCLSEFQTTVPFLLFKFFVCLLTSTRSYLLTQSNALQCASYPWCSRFTTISFWA